MWQMFALARAQPTSDVYTCIGSKLTLSWSWSLERSTWSTHTLEAAWMPEKNTTIVSLRTPEAASEKKKETRTNGVASLSEDLADLDVADDHIAFLVDTESDASKS